MAIYSWYRDSVGQNNKARETSDSSEINHSMWPTAEVRASLLTSTKALDTSTSITTYDPILENTESLTLKRN